MLFNSIDFAIFLPIVFERDRKQLLECLQLNPRIFSDAKFIIHSQNTPPLNSKTWNYIKKLLQNTPVQLSDDDLQALDQHFNPTEKKEPAAGMLSVCDSVTQESASTNSTQSLHSPALTALMKNITILDRVENKASLDSRILMKFLSSRLNNNGNRKKSISMPKSISLIAESLDSYLETNFSKTITLYDVLNKIMHEDNPDLLAEVMLIANRIEAKLNEHSLSDFPFNKLFMGSVNCSAIKCVTFLLENHFQVISKTAPDFEHVVKGKAFMMVANSQDPVCFRGYLNALLRNSRKDVLADNIEERLKGMIFNSSVTMDNFKILIDTLNANDLFEKQEIERVINYTFEYIRKVHLMDTTVHGSDVNLGIEWREYLSDIHSKIQVVYETLFSKFGLTNYSLTLNEPGDQDPNYNRRCAALLCSNSEAIRTNFLFSTFRFQAYVRVKGDDPTMVHLFTAYLDDNQFFINSRSIYHEIKRDLSWVSEENVICKKTQEQTDRFIIAGFLNGILRNLTIKLFLSKEAKTETADLFKKIVQYESTMKSPSIMNQFFFMLMRRMTVEVEGLNKLNVNINVWNVLKYGYIAAMQESSKVAENVLIASLHTFKHPKEQSSNSNLNTNVVTLSKEKSMPSVATNSNVSEPVLSPFVYPPAGDPLASVASTSLGIFTPILQVRSSTPVPPQEPLQLPDVPSEYPDIPVDTLEQHQMPRMQNEGTIG